jgi:hypothetical protein
MKLPSARAFSPDECSDRAALDPWQNSRHKDLQRACSSSPFHSPASFPKIFLNSFNGF